MDSVVFWMIQVKCMLGVRIHQVNWHKETLYLEQIFSILSN